MAGACRVCICCLCDTAALTICWMPSLSPADICAIFYDGPVSPVPGPCWSGGPRPFSRGGGGCLTMLVRSSPLHVSRRFVTVVSTLSRTAIASLDQSRVTSVSYVPSSIPFIVNCRLLSFLQTRPSGSSSGLLTRLQPYCRARFTTGRHLFL